ncbi:carbohydrate ABC transporter permease [Clostridium sp. DL1XJH146]
MMKTKNNSKNSKKILSKILINVFACLVSFVCLFPLIWMAYSSLKDKSEFMRDTLALPTKLVFSNFPKAFEIGNLWSAMGNSAFYVVINVSLMIVVSTITAYFFARYDFKGKGFMKFMYIMGMLIPLYALLVPLFVQYKMLNMINNRFALIITYYAMSISLAIFLTESFIEGIPVEIDEASIIDGCNMRQRLSKIIFPLCKPIIATTSILTLLSTWNEFAFAVILTPDKRLRTVSVAVRSYSTGRELDYTFLMAALLSTSLPVIITYIFFSKQVINGMTAGAVKG